MPNETGIKLSDFVRKSISLLEQRLNNFFSEPVQNQPQVAPVASPRQPEESSNSPPRIPPHDRRMYVHCASCNVVHELEAVCVVCGEPLCSDTRHCRQIRYNAQTGRNSVYCPTHAPIESKPSF
jgi:hypothetical protein